MRDLTEQEQAVLTALAKAWNDFLALPQSHPDDQPEFRRGLHTLQNIVQSRPAFESQYHESEPFSGAWSIKDAPCTLSEEEIVDLGRFNCAGNYVKSKSPSPPAPPPPAPMHVRPKWPF